MYRELEKGKGQNYGDDLIREIYNYIHKCNKEIQKEIDSKNSQTYLTDSDLRYIKKLKEKLRDEKVFDKYEFLFKKQMSPDPDDWGEPVSMDVEDNDFSVEDILDMPTESDLVSEPEQLAISKEKSADADTFPMNPVKTITIKKKEQNKEIPLEVKIQQYADDLYEQHGYDTEYEKSIFIVELAEK